MKANVFQGDGSLLTGIIPNGAWLLGGNSNTTPGVQFLGTRDNQPLQLKVNNAQALRLEPGSSLSILSEVTRATMWKPGLWVPPLVGVGSLSRARRPSRSETRSARTSAPSAADSTTL